MRARQILGAALAAATLLAVSAGCSRKDDDQTTATTTSTTPPETTSTTEPPLTAGRQIYSYVPEIGDCIDRRKPDPKKNDEVVLKLDCNLPHQLEVVGLLEVKDKDYPGEEALKEQGKKGCPKLFNDYIGAPYETSQWEMGYYTPSQPSWANGIRHVIGCTVYDASGRKLEGSKKGSKT